MSRWELNSVDGAGGSILLLPLKLLLLWYREEFVSLRFIAFPPTNIEGISLVLSNLWVNWLLYPCLSGGGNGIFSYVFEGFRRKWVWSFHSRNICPTNLRLLFWRKRIFSTYSIIKYLNNHICVCKKMKREENSKWVPRRSSITSTKHRYNEVNCSYIFHFSYLCLNGTFCDFSPFVEYGLQY